MPKRQPAPRHRKPEGACKRIRTVAIVAGLIAALVSPSGAYAYVQREEIVSSGHGYISPSHLVVHETANPGASASNHVKLWSRGYAYACQYVMELDGSVVYHTMADNRKAWAVGNGNAYTVSIELAHATNAEDFYSQYSQAAQWCANYLKSRGWGVDRLLSHNDCRLKWGGTDHTDPTGYFRTYGRTWDGFKSLVSQYMGSGSYQPSKVVNVPSSVSNGTSTAKTGTGFGGTYTCTVSALNVRTSPTGSVVGTLRKGRAVQLADWYTIVNGYVWGQVSYGGATRYVAVGKATGSVSASDYLIKGGRVSSTSKAALGGAGRYRFSTAVRIRTGAGTGYRAVGTYRAGQTVNIARTVSSGGYVWGVYTGASGYTRHVALGTVSGKAYASRV